MLRMFRELKGSYRYIVLIFALLFGQAFCDLALPSYTSDIINVGVQQGGIPDSVPDQIREGKTDHAGTIDSPIGRTDQSLILRQVDHENGDSACTHYLQKCWHPKTFYPETLPVPQDGLSLVQLQLETGRTHQIRVHMTSIGHPLIGDTLYNPETALMNRQALHSYRLAFTHPVTGVSLEFTSPLPEDMVEFFPDCNT